MSHPLRPALALVVLSMVVLAPGCGGKKSSPTSPSPSGSPTFDFSFGSVGTSHSLTFPNEGHFGYHCAPHRTSGMVGAVHVVSGGPDSATVEVGPGGTLTFSPSTALIKPGGSVRWTRPSGSTFTNHTATND